MFCIPPYVAGWASGLITLSAFTAYGPYFDKKKAISVGISGSGSGLGTIIIPIILRTLFDNYSFTGAMLIFCKYKDLNLVIEIHFASCWIALTYDTRLCFQSIANCIAIAKKLVTSGNATTTSIYITGIFCCRSSAVTRTVTEKIKIKDKVDRLF